MPTLIIESEEAFRLVTELAEREGKDITTLLIDLAREKLAQDRVPEREPGIAARLIALGDRTAPHGEEPWKSTPHGDLLYDEDGLPR